MSYTLRGRIDSRLVAALVPLLGACVLAVSLPAWWPVGLVGLMLIVGLALDILVYDVIEYQPGWLALPLGLLELVLVIGLVRALGWTPPLVGALALFGVAWLLAQTLAQAGFPILALSYAEGGGELNQVGVAALVATAGAFVVAGAIGWATLPPTIHLAAGVHQGPLLLDRPQTLVGEPGAIVRGGIVIRADHVIVRGVTIEGGENGIDVDEAHHVLLDRVQVRDATMDGIHVRRSHVRITNCTIQTPEREFTQGIDIAFSLHRGMSVVEGCVVRGGQQGIVTHSAMVMVEHNDISETSLRGIDMTEMSMGEIHSNRVADATGIGIFCGDYSECEIERNHVAGTRPDPSSGDTTRAGIGIVAHYHAHADTEDNELVGNAKQSAAFVGARLRER